MKKKILLLPSWYPTNKRPLIGSYFKEQAEFLRNKDGMDIQVLYGQKKSSPLLGWIWVFIKSLWPIFNGKVEYDPPSFCFTFPANRRVSDFLQIGLEQRLFWKAYKSFIRAGWVPDLIHAQSGMDAGIYAHHINKMSNLPFVIIEHQTMFFHHYSKERGRLVLEAYKAANKLGVVSYAQRRQLMMHEPDCYPLILPNLLNEDRFSLRENSIIGLFHIITVMYPQSIKGYKTFFKALKFLKDLNVDFRFTVIGNGGDLFQGIIRELKIENFGKIIEKVERLEIPKILSQSHLYVCSSDFETFGIAPREAMLCGLPVVSTANGGVEDIITLENGIIVPVRDPEALAKAIMKVKDNFSNYSPDYIRKHVVQQCGKVVFLEKMKRFYDL